MKKNIIIGILVLVVLILLGRLSSKSELSTEILNQDLNQDLGSEENFGFDITDIGASDGANPNITVTSRSLSKIPSPVTVGEDTYAFSGVAWLFTETGISTAGIPQTSVRISLEDFTRSGSRIDLATFRLGQHQGTCSAVESIPSSSADGAPLAFAQCDWAGQGIQLAVFQKNNLIISKLRKIIEGKPSVAPFQEINVIDITSLIK